MLFMHFALQSAVLSLSPKPKRLPNILRLHNVHSQSRPRDHALTRLGQDCADVVIPCLGSSFSDRSDYARRSLPVSGTYAKAMSTDLNSRVPLSWKQPYSLFLLGLVASCCPGVVHLEHALTGSRFSWDVTSIISRDTMFLYLMLFGISRGRKT